MKEIEIRISPDGEVDFEAMGFKGQGCEKAINEIIKKLGAIKTEESKKSEYFQTNTSGAKVSA